MKMVEEQSHNSPKRIKIEKKDRMSSLPDCLLVEILSRLPSTKEAIKTSILSKRWTRVWTNVYNLIFRYDENAYDDGYIVYGKRKYSRFDFFLSVDRTIHQCSPQLMLNKFELELKTSRNVQVDSLVNTWIRFAISRNVQELHFKFCIDSEAEFVLDRFFFNNSCSTDLKLSGCVFNPVGAITWANLRRLYIQFGRLDEDLIENMLSGSPLMETLALDNCYGYRRLDITSKSVKNLVFFGYGLLTLDNKSHDHDDIIEINAPNILSLKIQDDLLLWELVLLDVSSLVEAELDYTKGGFYETTRKEAKEEMLKGFILKLSHVKELKIGKYCYKVLSGLEAKGFSIPSNLKVADDVTDITSSVYSDNDLPELDDTYDYDCLETSSEETEVMLRIVMKMAEEQSHISPKRIKIEKKDRMSALPDCLLVDILSRLQSTKEAVRTCILSKRWTHVWTNVYNLIFRYDDDYVYGKRKYSRSDFFSSVDKTLNQRSPQLMLNKLELELNTSHTSKIESQVNNWIRYAINCNVQQLDFKFWIMYDEAEFMLDQAFFNNSCITDMKLSGCVFKSTGEITWKNLKSLHIQFANMEEDLIQNMLSGSPVLETLVLDTCHGFRRLDITSKSVKNLVFCGYEPPGYESVELEPWEKKSDLYEDVIKINAPNILSLTIQDTLWLSMLLLVDVSSVVKAELATIGKEARERTLKRFLLKLPHVEELKIGKYCFKALTRLEAKGFIIPSNVKVPDADDTSSVYSDSDSLEIDYDWPEPGDMYDGWY